MENEIKTDKEIMENNLEKLKQSTARLQQEMSREEKELRIKARIFDLLSLIERANYEKNQLLEELNKLVQQP